MTNRIENRLRQLGITLPTPSEPGGNYLPFVIAGNLIYLAGQTPFEDGVRKFIGKVGRDLDVREGQTAARLCAVNLLAKLKIACGGNLDKVSRCVKLLGFVNATPEFGEHPKVINGASDFFVEVFGDIGGHARSAVGMSSLPFGAAVEIEAIFEFAA
jgi:enamine deaminase RidA (YjgF/YER057c/UK114 family)